MGMLIGNAVIGIFGGYFGLGFSWGFYQYTWGGRGLGSWVFTEPLSLLSDTIIIAPILGGILGGAVTDKWWGAFGGGFFLSILGFYFFTFGLNAGF
jgi:hypothetical protein